MLMSCKYYTEQQLNVNIQLSVAMGIYTLNTLMLEVLTKTLTK